MNDGTQSSLSNQPYGEDTLRLIANLPAPEGLEERVKAGLRAAPRTARILSFPSVLRPGSEWMRSAAAAAIAFVVVGGGWGVYTRVQQSQPAGVIVMPQRLSAPGSFAGAGAMRTPTTLNGPVVANSAAAKPLQGNAGVQTRQRSNRHASSGRGKLAPQSAVSTAK